jgi:DMSO/TMAO reductase YedYZ molybdopterin-dependent catalytic subunit
VTRYAGRTANGIPRMAQTHAANPTLRIGGLVGRPLDLVPAELEILPRVPYLGELSCVEGGNVPQVNWAGIRLSDLVALADPVPEARFVCVKAGPYGVPVALEDAAGVLLCDRLDDAPLSVENGGPWRLVVPGSRYFTSVKWVDNLEITAEAPDNSAERIARARARARGARAS